MGHIWVREFTGGLDTRRMPETSPGGVLIQGEDGHLTRGGDFETRASFVPAYTLPPGTVDMAYQRTGIVVFGSDPPPTMPAGVTYQRLQHPSGTPHLLEVPSFDLYRGKIYAVGVFSDGSRHHFYDGVRVDDWYDGRARATFRVTGGGAQPATPATGSFRITAGTVGGGNQITSVSVDGSAVTSGAVAHTGDDGTTAEAVASNINSYSSSYTAIAEGDRVVITAVALGSASNGFAVVAVPGGNVSVADETPLAGGAEASVSEVTSITVGGAPIIFTAIQWGESNEATAAAIAEAVNSAATNPEYDAISIGDQVVIIAAAAGIDENTRTVTVQTANGFSVTPSTTVMAGGSDSDDTFEPGLFNRTIGSKMYSTSGSVMHFSGIQNPTGWTTDNVGAGFIDMSTQSSGSEELMALAKYQQNVAVFSIDNILVWYVDPDPTLNRLSQVLNNTGTVSPKSVTQFGDNDIFYLSESGLRSLRARDSSNAAATTDIGNPVDHDVTTKLRSLTVAERARVTGLIEPRDGRFWLTMKDQIFVFTFFGGAKISAWSRYHAKHEGQSFDIDNAVVFNKRVHLRSGDTIYVYGGLGEQFEYDDTEAVMQIPYLDAGQPWQRKNFTGFDMAGTGEWRVYAAMNPTNLAAQDVVGTFADTIAQTTFNDGRIPGAGEATHFSLIFKSRGVGPSTIASVVLHFEAADEDSG